MSELDESAFRELSKHLKKGGTYGLKKNELTRATLVNPYIFYLLQKFARLHVPIHYTTIAVNGKPPKGCKEYYIVGFGNYTGGELRIGETVTNIWRRPQILKQPVEHLPVTTGTRMTLTFYALETPLALWNFEPIVVDEKWVIKQISPPLYLIPTTRLKPTQTLYDDDDIPNDAIEFLKRVIKDRQDPLSHL
jgi:hypothetical protein